MACGDGSSSACWAARKSRGRTRRVQDELATGPRGYSDRNTRQSRLGRGQTARIIQRFPATQPEIRSRIGEFIENGVDVIVAISVVGAHDAKELTSSIPIVVVLATDLAGTGLAESLAHPGGDVTGLSLMSEDLHSKRLALLKEAVPTRIPTMGYHPGIAQDGLLMAYRQDYNEFARKAAVYVDKILKGAKPADLPIEQPTQFKLAINLKTAKALGLTLPASLIVSADEVIE